MNFNDLLEMFLVESTLTKGSQRVMGDKGLVSGLADALRDDSRSNPPAFPPNFARTAQKTSDEDLAKWFLENIDRIEREGYEGTVYSRDGVNNDWIARKYVSGAHSWEDITGVMNMNLRDWYLLKNRNMLDANHKDLPKFNGVRDLGYYITTHYKNQMDKIRDAAKNAARNKMAKSVKLVDNDDYRIYTTLNRAAGCALGLGTQWCTANSASGQHYHSYSNRAMLFQMFPYKKHEVDGKNVNVTDEDGKKELADNEKYQFDSGTPNFMDVNDNPVRPEIVQKKFPYLYTDLSAALKQNKEKMEQAFKELSVDPTLQGEDYKIKTYEIDDEIQKLSKFVQRGYFTDEKRPVKRPPAEVQGDQPQMIQAPQGEQPEQGPAQMEDIYKLALSMLNEDDVDNNDVDEEEEMPDAAATGGDLGTMGGGAGPSGGGKYAPGTAPTMPESINIKGTPTMENVDKDVAAMLQSLKKYDKLVESVAPVLGMRTLGEKDEGKHNNGTTTGFKAVAKNAAKEYGSKEAGEKVAGAVRNKMKASGKIEEAEDDKNPWLDLAKKDEKKSGKTTKTDTGLKHEKDYDAKDEKEDKKEDVKEGADSDVLSWMKRFASLGNMKGYGK